MGVIALGVMNSAIAAACSRLADKEQLGGFFGVLESVESVAGLVGPMLGGLLARAHSPTWPSSSHRTCFLREATRRCSESVLHPESPGGKCGCGVHLSTGHHQAGSYD